MNENHRKLILCNLDKLIDVTEYSTIKNSCLKKEIITETMAQNIEGDGSNETERNFLLFKKITHRGPKAFDKLLEILKENNYNEALVMLTQSASFASATFKDEEVAMEEETFVSISSTRNNLIERQLSYPPSINNIIDEADKMLKNDGPFQSKESRNFHSKDNKVKLEPYEKITTFQFTPIPEVKRASSYGTHPKLGVYNMKSKKRGVFFFANIINFPEKDKSRSGADCDRENLITLFREMGFKIFYYEDIKREQFITLIRELSESDYLKGVDSFVMCVQTHGTIDFNKTLMEFSDGATWGVEEVIELFSNKNCEALANKPKVFFFPFCRGPKSDVENKLKRYQASIQTDGSQNAGIPSYSDILLCYGTVPGFATHRDVQFGSWYARELCKVFAEHAWDTHIEDMMKMVSSKTLQMRDEGRLQVASTENRGFNKLLFFNPRI